MESKEKKEEKKTRDSTGRVQVLNLYHYRIIKDVLFFLVIQNDNMEINGLNNPIGQPLDFSFLGLFMSLKCAA